MSTEKNFDAVFFLAALAGLLTIPLGSGLTAAALKSLPVVILAVSWLVLRQPGWRWLAPALFFAAAGDFLLALGGLFLPGMGSFAVMQLLYLAHFWKLALARPRPRKGLLVYPLLFAGITAAMLAVFLPHLGALALPMALYGVVLATMTSGAWASGRGWLLGVGATLFFVSDALILVFRVWKDPTDLHSWAIMITYYAGQFAITRGART